MHQPIPSSSTMTTKAPKDSDFKCSLSGDVLEKAKKELKETPDTRMVEIKQLRKRLEKVPGLQPRTDAAHLLAFLRARKFDQEKAFQMIKNHYQEKHDRRDHYDDIKPSKVKHVIDSGILEVLKERDNNGCRVIILRPGRWDPDRYPVYDGAKLMFLVLSKLAEEEDTQVHGIHVIDLLDTVTLKHAVHVTPGFSKLINSTMQDMLPLRLKRFDFVKEPSFFHTVFPIIKMFMSEKLLSRLHFNGESYEKLHTTIDPKHLPTDLGGELEPFSFSKEWMGELMAAEKNFEYNNKFGFLSMSLQNEKKESHKEDAGLQGLGGTFKKLDV